MVSASSIIPTVAAYLSIAAVMQELNQLQAHKQKEREIKQVWAQKWLQMREEKMFPTLVLYCTEMPDTVLNSQIYFLFLFDLKAKFLVYSR